MEATTAQMREKGGEGGSRSGEKITGKKKGPPRPKKRSSGANADYPGEKTRGGGRKLPVNGKHELTQE